MTKVIAVFVLSTAIFLAACGGGGGGGNSAPAPAAQATVDPDTVAASLPTCDQATASDQSRKDATALLQKETERLQRQTDKLQAETDQVVSDYQAGRISQADAQAKAEPLKARAYALKDQTATANALTQCLKGNQ